ncbi:hypothetical protein D3C86_2109890 [compost metagenome]
MSGEATDTCDEVDEARWWPLDQTLPILTYKSERETVEKAISMLRDRGELAPAP